MMVYRPEIDGIRAIAVLIVLFFHSGILGFSGGYVGVDVFFVISGYLITMIILKELQSNSFSMINFYERRARRILPALFFVILFCIPISYFILLPNDLYDFGESLIAVPTFISNFLFWSERGYFGGSIELKPLVHTWSLAVEEQFYIFFPLLLSFLYFRAKKIIGLVIILITITSLGLSYFITKLHFETAFYLPFTRAWELMMGAICALYYKQLEIKKNSYAFFSSLIGILLIAFSVYSFDENTLFPGMAATIPVIGTFLIIISDFSNNILYKLLSSKLFVSFGLISYSLYLWHQPIFAFMRHLDFENHIVFFGIPASIFASIISYRYIEKPFRDKNNFSRKTIFLSSGIMSLLIIIVGVLMINSNGFISRFSNSDQILMQQFINQANYNKKFFDKIEMLPFAEKNYRKKVLIIGDSYAKDILNVIQENPKRDKYQFSTKQINSECGNLYVKKDLTQYIPKDRLSRCNRMSRYENKDLIDLIIHADEVWLINSWQKWQLKYIKDSYESLVEDFGNKFRVFSTKNFGDINQKMVLSINENDRANYTQASPKLIQDINYKISLLIPENNYIDINDLFCFGDETQCRIFTNDGVLISTDGGHLTKAGAAYFGNSLINVLENKQILPSSYQ